MRMLSEEEIRKIAESIQKKTENLIYQSEGRAVKEREEFKARQEKQYQSALQMYQSQYEQYERSLKRYEADIKREEEEYPKRIKAWKENEELRKRLIEQSYQQAVAAYERSKKEHEAFGLPFSHPIPKKVVYAPLPKPGKRVFYKPNPPIVPKKPIERKDPFKTGFSSFSFLAGMMFTSSFSGRAVRQLSRIDISSPEGKKVAYQIIFRELYLDKRIEMECSWAEGRAVSPKLDGLYGEKLTVFELELCILAGFKGNILHNLEIEIGNRTIQIDILFITPKGIFVIESKHYSGSISGAEYQDKWTLHTPRKNYNFYNPIAQNQSHINVLSKIVQIPRWFSLIAFSERCDLEYIDIHKQDVFAFNRYALRDVITDIFSGERDVLSAQDVDAITNILRQYCADEPDVNPNYKELRSYFSSRTKVDEQSNVSYQHHRYGGGNPFMGSGYDDDYDDDDDYDYDDDFDDYDD